MCKVHALAALAISVLLASSGCKAETSIGDYPCPPDGTKLTYDNFGAEFMAANCQTCHGQPDGQRAGAPEGYDFGTLDAVRAKKDRIFARAAADNTTMPPGPDDPPRDERDQLAEWLACGTP